jgi:hypothetical protein
MLRARLPNVALNWLRDIMYPPGKTVVMATSQAAMVNLAMALAHGDLPTGKIHTDDLWSACADRANARLETVANHADMQDFVPYEFRNAHKFKNVAQTKPYVFSGSTATAYDRGLELKRVVRNDMLPLLLAVCRRLGFVSRDGHSVIPSGHQLPELLNAFNEALFVHDQKKKKRGEGQGGGKAQTPGRRQEPGPERGSRKR